MVMISLVLLMLPSSALRVSADSGRSGYKFNIVYSEDGTSADIVGDGSAINPDTQIKGITDPDGGPLNLDNVSYHVTQNGSYTFKVNYISQAGEQSEEDCKRNDRDYIYSEFRIPG